MTNWYTFQVNLIYILKYVQYSIVKLWNILWIEYKINKVTIIHWRAVLKLLATKKINCIVYLYTCTRRRLYIYRKCLFSLGFCFFFGSVMTFVLYWHVVWILGDVHLVLLSGALGCKITPTRGKKKYDAHFPLEKVFLTGAYSNVLTI